MTDTTRPLHERLQDALGDAFQVERELGRGGMATVFLALDTRHQRRVAIKVVNPELGVDLTAGRFKREIEVAAGLNHPHIVPLLDSGTAGGLRYYMMPYVEGESLRARLDRERQLPVSDSLRLARDVAEALQAAHDRGLVHRDIKPENILLSRNEAVVTDFGIARAMQSVATTSITQTGLVVGTPVYMSPEQAAGGPVVDGRSDVYALGCVLYEMLVGHAPFQGSTPQEIMSRHALDPVPPMRSARPSISESLELIVQRALAKNPADRFASAAEFASVLEEARTTGSTAQLRLSGRRQAMASVRRNIRTGGLVLVGALLLVVAVLFGRRLARAPSEPGGTVARLAVLPLENIGVDDPDRFADGLTDEIAVRLARLSDVAVIARNNTVNYPRAGKTVQTIGRELGVDYLLEGQVRWSESGGERRVRVTPSLVRVSDGAQLWADQLDGVVADVFTLQTRLAQRVAEALPIRLAPAERRALGTAATANVDAYRAYTLGRHHWRQRTIEGLQRAVEHFTRALQLDPLFARAYAGLADCYVLFHQFGALDLPRDIVWARAREAASQAVSLDPGNAEALASLAEVIFYADWDWPEADRYFRQSIAADPNYATGRQWYAEFLTVTGRFDDAIVQAERAALLDPVSGIVNHALAIALLGARRYDDALAQYERVLELDPALGYAMFGRVWAHIGRRSVDDAVRAMAAMGDTSALARAWIRGAVDSSYRPEARRVVRNQGAVVANWPLEIRASVLAAIDDRDGAFALLEQMVREKGAAPPGVLVLPLYDPLRNDPRYRRVLEQLRLIQ